MESVDEWIEKQNFKTTKEIKVPPRLVDQVIGQDEAVEVIKKAAQQKRHVIMIGDPGTGKSMLAQSMVDFLPKEELEDILVFPNEEDPNKPIIKTVPAGQGKYIVKQYQEQAKKKKNEKKNSMFSILFLLVLIGGIAVVVTGNYSFLFWSIFIAIFLYMFMGAGIQKEEKALVPKLLVSHSPNDKPPFIDATGSHAGALLGDVRHDPFQSGGLETPPHLRVEAGAIHKAHKGVLFIDEINMLKLESQQSLLTAMQEKKFPISGQSEHSAGAMVHTEPVPCDFILVAAGNLDALQGMHPALRSRIRGYGYEVYMKSVMEDNDENRKKLVRFVAQEVVKDGKIPHFTKAAVAEIIKEAQKRAGRKGKLTLRLRELGGLIRVAGDIAREEKAKFVDIEHVIKAKKLAKPLEQQVADRLIEIKKEYKTFLNKGEAVGIVNGLAVYSAGSGMAEYSGIVLPIMAEVTPAQSRDQGRMIATGKLGEIAKEAVENVSAIIKKYFGKHITNYDVHIQFIGTYEGVEGDSASISVATAVVSALEGIPVNQNIAMTGSLSIRGHVLPVGGITAKVEAAIEAGLEKVIIPKSNLMDVILDEEHEGKIEVIPVSTVEEVLRYALVDCPKKEELLKKFEEIQGYE
ncbi:ATP-dependent protease LonB [Candidatus Aciduliprofundum boonei]|uniref:Archaeal Lon protease n=1 Tax=Aciduliprofundum boonei (strain DSM 19572 / T469) TaxID=439481 RepID=B5ID19_ACIB4|nr:ATP-dependent protease LonB [Candidatus Aciduliprofundum boonei]ADD09215.1 peptidase S16, Lon-like protease [Aciduliprofundum boonei T469]EDY35844.1 ATP-dependent protease, putative [Aciduliprofundum boonei T469]HII55821.1 ATP-dependent protease LonB [Candidatus Aciduliprofundum boonei]